MIKLYILKSLLVLLFLLALIIFSIYLIISCFKQHRNRMLKTSHVLFTAIFICGTILSIMLFGDYTYPFERTLDPILIAEFDVPEGYELEFPGQKYWHGAYEKFGFYAESFYFNPNNLYSIYGFGWPPMDFEHYCYIITYGQKIDTLSYNVWETIDIPIRTGAKVGHMVLDDEFFPEKVYVYQIPKIRIENDRNDINSPWD